MDSFHEIGQRLNTRTRRDDTPEQVRANSIDVAVWMVSRGLLVYTPATSSLQAVDGLHAGRPPRAGRRRGDATACARRPPGGLTVLQATSSRLQDDALSQAAHQSEGSSECEGSQV